MNCQTLHTPVLLLLSLLLSCLPSAVRAADGQADFKQALALMKAGKLSELDRLLKAYPSNRGLFESAAVKAVAVNDLETLLKLWASDKDIVNATDVQGQHLLTLAASAGNHDLVAFLLAGGCSIDVRNQQGVQPLSLLIQAESTLEQLQAILDKGASLQDGNIRNETALTYAIRAGDRIVIDHLLKSGADITQGHNLYAAGLHPDRAALFDYILAQGASVSIGGDAGMELLDHCMSRGWSASFFRLVKAGADPFADLKRFQKILQSAVRNKMEAVVDWLLANDKKAYLELIGGQLLVDAPDVPSLKKYLALGIKPDFVSLDGHVTPLCAALFRSSTEQVKLLLDAGADPNFATHDWRNPLFFAPTPEFIDLLVKHGADPNRTLGNGSWNALADECLDQYGEDRPDRVKALLKNGADPGRYRRVHGHSLLCGAKIAEAKVLIAHGEPLDWTAQASPLVHAAKIRDKELIDFYMQQLPKGQNHKALFLACLKGCFGENEVNEYAEDDVALFTFFLGKVDGQLPDQLVYEACWWPALVPVVIKHGADPNTRGDYKAYTLLHQAVESGRPELVEVLLKHGANPRLKTTDGKLPIDLAVDTAVKIKQLLTTAMQQDP